MRVGWRWVPFGLVALIGGCRDSARSVEGRWQGGSEPTALPAPTDGQVAMSFTLRQDGDSLHGWGVARTDGGSFPITARGTTSRRPGADSVVTIAISLSPWRAGVIDVLAAQVQGTLTARGEVKGTLRTDGGIGPGGTPIVLRRP